MPFANTAPLRREIAARIPDRPFTVRFWDGTSLPATAGEDGPTFTVRPPRPPPPPLRAPRQPRLGRAPARPFTVRFWDGPSLPATAGEDGPTFTVRSPRAAAHALRAPGQLGLGRAYVSGELEVDDIDAVIALLGNWQPPALDGGDKRALLVGAVRAAGITAPPPRPAAELVPSGRRHSKERDARAVRHHYDVSNEFFGLFLDESMT